jgi:hypothetical protein
MDGYGAAAFAALRERRLVQRLPEPAIFSQCEDTIRAKAPSMVAGQNSPAIGCASAICISYEAGARDRLSIFFRRVAFGSRSLSRVGKRHLSSMADSSHGDVFAKTWAEHIREAGAPVLLPLASCYLPLTNSSCTQHAPLRRQCRNRYL